MANRSLLSGIAAWWRGFSLSVRWLVAFSGTFLLSEFIDWLTKDWLTDHVWRPIVAFLGWLIQRPISGPGLVLVAWTAILTLGSFLSHTAIGLALSERIRPPRTAAAPPPSAPQPSETELRLINDIRVLWNRHGLAAAQALWSLLDGLVRDLGDVYWKPLLITEAKRFDNNIGALTEAVADNNPFTLAEVQNRFNDVYAGYHLAAKRIAEMLREHGDIINAHEQHAERYKTVQAAHPAFRDKMLDLAETPGHKGRLSVYHRLPMENSGEQFLSGTKSERDPIIPPKDRAMPQ